MQSTKTLTIEAPAKINLYLKILGRRADGYHEIESLMQKLELADILHIDVRDAGISLKCPDSDLPEDETNLVYKAAQSFLSYTGINRGVALRVEKKIPIAAGLGGGSSDAAAVLSGLNKLFETNLPQKKLFKLAVPLGADVAFFVNDQSAAVARGIGERLSFAQSLPPCWILLVNPGFAVSTKWVYENLALTSEGNPYILAPGQNCSSGPDDLQKADLFQDVQISIFNDLESVTIQKYPELGFIKDDLLADSALCALMSGSGPTVFGLFDTEDKAKRSAEKFQDAFGENVIVTRPLNAT